jgi:hypothetical protein
MAMTATVNTANAYVALFIDFTTVPGVQTSARVWRITPDLEETEIVGSPVSLLGEQAYMFDTTAPLDVAVTYRADPNVGDSLTAGPVTVPSNGFVWFKDPGRPWANLRVDLCSQLSPEPCDTEIADPIALLHLGQESRSEDVNLPGILNRERPVDIYARRKDVVTSVTFASKTLAAVDDIYILFTAGGPLFIQTPAVYGWPDRFVQPLELTMDYVSIDQRRPWRAWNVPLVVVDQPIGTPQGVDGETWCDLQDAYATYDEFAGQGFTWGDVAAGDAIPVAPLTGYGSGVYGGPPVYGG